MHEIALGLVALDSSIANLKFGEVAISPNANVCTNVDQITNNRWKWLMFITCKMMILSCFRRNESVYSHQKMWQLSCHFFWC